MPKFDYNILTAEDLALGMRILDGKWASIEDPDLIIAPRGIPYLYRWHLFRDSGVCSDYLHIQVSDDPERPLHDHPWDNFSVILSGGYNEEYECAPELVSPEYYPRWKPSYRCLRKGSTVFRKATTAHRLVLPPGVPYTMTRFSTGPKVRDWGFWYPGGFRDYRDCTEVADGVVSVHLHGDK